MRVVDLKPFKLRLYTQDEASMDGYQHPAYSGHRSSSATEGSCDRRASWYPGPPTYQVNAAVNAANVALLPNQTPLYRPSINQSFLNQSGIPFAALPESTQDARDATWLGLGTGAGGKHTDSRDTVTDISIRVINPKKKRDAKTYILKDVHPQMI